MAIEFHCTHCGRLLRTPSDTTGKQAKCPECSAITPIPASCAGPPDSDAEGSFAPGEAPTLGPGDAENFYHTSGPAKQPRQPNQQSAQWIHSRVSGPAVGLIVAGALSIALSTASLPLQALRFAIFPFPRLLMPFGFAGGIGLAAGIPLGIVIIIGAVRMKNLQSYGFAMTAAILAMIPCLTPCCALGLPFGIWALVVLSDPQVKAAFRS